MALISCSECGKEVSDQAPACPGCGASVATTKQQPVTSASPTIGLVATGLGLGGVLMPYFAAVFFVPAAAICGIAAFRRGQKGLGLAGIVLGLIGLVGIVSVSQQITGFARNPSGSVSLPQPAFGPPPIVTKAEYDQIREGMTYEQVRSIIGATGEELSRSDLAGFTTIMYSWSNSNGSNMNAMFQNNRLINKAQFGLP